MRRLSHATVVAAFVAHAPRDAPHQQQLRRGHRTAPPRVHDLTPQPPTMALYSNTTYAHDPVSATALPVLAGGHPVYGLKFQSGSPTGLPCPTSATCAGNRGQAYNNGHVRAKGVAVGGQSESVYGVFGDTDARYRALLGIPADLTIVAGVTLGRPLPDPGWSALTSRATQRRRALDELVHWNAWRD